MGVSFALVFWDGEERTYGAGPTAFRVVLKSREACASILRDPNLRFGEAYSRGEIAVEGDLQHLFRAFYQSADPLNRYRSVAARLSCWFGRWRAGSRTKARQDVPRHYDLGNEFFALWLGNTMAYSCAYFEDPQASLDEAQHAKFGHLARKLQMADDITVLDIGCGWGDLLLHLASRWRIRGVGITLSREQCQAATARVKEHKLEERIRIECADYREMNHRCPFDRVVSVGMFEHVGRSNMRDYMDCTRRLLKPRGIGVLHSIGRIISEPTNAWIDRYVFPGAYFPTLDEIAASLAACGMCTLDVENLRFHYYLTLIGWLRNFEAVAASVSAKRGEEFTRTWRFYLNSCAAAFAGGLYELWQIQFSHGHRNDLPLTRRYLYPPRTCYPVGNAEGERRA